MTVTITLTTAGADTGPFNIFSDASIPAFSTALNAAPILRSSILAGVTLQNVPDGTTVLRVKSTGTCENYIDIEVVPPSQCGQFLFQGGPSNGNIVTYKDCSTGVITPLLLNKGDTVIKCAYVVPPYYPAFTSGVGIISPQGSCVSTNKLSCKEYTFYANVGEGGAVFRYIPCDEFASTEEIVADGDTLVVCSSPYFIPQVVSGSGTITDPLVNCTTTTSSTTAPL